MTKQAAVPTSALHAERLLNAWNRGDVQRLEQEFEYAMARPAMSVEQAIEEERWELLEAIIGQMRSSVQLGAVREKGEGDAWLALLRHLQSAGWKS